MTIFLIVRFRINNYCYQVDKIIQERWRNIERTTRYGWLTAISQRASISREDAKVLSTLACKVSHQLKIVKNLKKRNILIFFLSFQIGYENSNKACHRIKKACRDLHPFDIPKMAMSVLDETYTALILKYEKYFIIKFPVTFSQ